MSAELCPVCCGTGKYGSKECHGCNGKGWVETTDIYSPRKPLVEPHITITWQGQAETLTDDDIVSLVEGIYSYMNKR
jgi:DnaJ-class molecular chaperone